MLEELITLGEGANEERFPTENLEQAAAVCAQKMINTARDTLSGDDKKDAKKIAAGVKKIMELLHRDLKKAGY